MTSEMERKELEVFLELISEDKDNIKRVTEEIEDEDIEARFIVHSKAETVEQSARQTGVEREQIVKTLVFVGDEPIAVMCPGHLRVSESKLAELNGSSVEMADPSTVKEATGYVVGGVSPFDLDIPVYADERILENEKVKPAAGSRVVGAVVDPEELLEAVDAEVVDVAE